MTQDFMHAFMALDALPFKEGATREMVGLFARFLFTVVLFVFWFLLLMRFAQVKIIMTISSAEKSCNP
jgi:hypothetical protein